METNEAEYFCQNQKLSYENIQYLTSDFVIAIELIGKDVI